MTKQPLLSGFEDLFSCSPPQVSDDIVNFPNLSHDTLTRYAKWFGTAGELFVDSTLLRFGIHTSHLPEMLSADRIMYHGENALRLQIKTCCRARNGSFHFSLSRGYHRSPGGVTGYAESDFDLVVLVALSENAIKFTADKRRSQSISLREIEGLREDPCASLNLALADLGLSGIGTSIAAHQSDGGAPHDQ